MTFQVGNPGRPAIRASKELSDLLIDNDDPDFKALDQYAWDDWCKNECPSRNDYCKTHWRRASISATP